jgi:hypothetical protein
MASILSRDINLILYFEKEKISIEKLFNLDDNDSLLTFLGSIFIEENRVKHQ